MSAAAPWIRPIDQVLARIHALAAVVGLEEGADPDDVQADMDEHGLVPWLAVNELVFYEHRVGIEQADEEDLEVAETDVSWRPEALWALLWAVGYVPELDPRTPAGGSEPYNELAPGLDPAETAEDVALRTAEELTAERERHEVLVRDGAEGVDHGIVVERRNALAWVLTDATWDEVEDA